MARKTNIGLAEYCNKQIGRPYWLGGFGQRADKEFYDRNKNRLQYGPWEGDYEKAEGQKVHDCCGLVKGYYWTDGPDVPWKPGQYEINGLPDWGVEEQYAHCSEKGKIDTIPEMAGVLVFTSSMSHMGIYIGSGKVVEARGHAYGVQKNTLKDRSFALWGKLDVLTYEKPVSEDFNGEIKKFQIFLNSNYGNSISKITGRLEVDGRCGRMTKKAAVVAMQNELNKLGERLSIDGGPGILTRQAMSRHMVKRGTKGNMAYIVQGLLYGAGYDCNGFDGSIGAGCDAAIRKYQADKGLEVDGKVGGETLYKLTGC
jgi:hypothetical protein